MSRMLLVEVRSLRGLAGSRARLYAAVDDDIAAVVVLIVEVPLETERVAEVSCLLPCAFCVVIVVEDKEAERGGGGKGLKFE